jgi:DHA1 family tetracycline resistance protein-like MFS transporter
VKRGPLSIIFAIVFIDLMGFGIVIPLLPLYAEHYRPSPLEFGLLLSSYSAMQFLFAPVLGKLSDRFGRKPILILSLAGSVIGYVLFGLARSLSVLFASRIIDGISGGNISTAQAYIADVTTEDQRTRGMGLIGAAFGLGFVFGPAIAGFTVHLGESAPGIAAAALSALAMLGTIFYLPEPERKSAEGSRLAARTFEPAGFARAIRKPAVALILAIFFLVTFSFSNFEATFAQFLHDTLQLSPSHVAFLFVYVGILVALVQGGLVHRLSRAVGERKLVLAGTALLAVGLGVLPFSATVALTMLLLVPLTLGIGSANPSLSSLISKSVGESERGSILGAFQSMSSLGRILGPMWGEYAYARLGPTGPHWTGAIFAASAAMISVFLLGRR